MSLGATADIDVEALLFRHEAFAAEVPFANVAGDVAGFLERLGDGNFFQCEMVRVRRGQQTSFRGAANVVSDARAWRIFASHQRGTCW